MGIIYFADRPFSVEFPGVVINEIGLNLGDKFCWYPQKEDWIEPEDCHKEPIKYEPLDWGSMVAPKLKEAIQHLEALQNKSKSKE